MAAAVHLRRDSHAWSLRANIQRADSLRPVNLVRGDRREVDPRLLEINRHLANRLHRVGVEHDSFFFRDLADLGNRMKRADLVVGPHDRDEHGLVGDRVAHRVRIDHPVLVDRQIGHCRLAGTLERAATVEHGLVLGDATDDVVALIFVKLDDALDCQVVGLGGAAGENNFLGLGADQRGDLVARATDGLFRFPSEAMVAAGGVAELLGEIREHRIEHTRIDARGRMIVHINRLLQHFFSIHLQFVPALDNSGPARYSIRLLQRQSNEI